MLRTDRCVCVCVCLCVDVRLPQTLHDQYVAQWSVATAALQRAGGGGDTTTTDAASEALAALRMCNRCILHAYFKWVREDDSTWSRRWLDTTSPNTPPCQANERGVLAPFTARALIRLGRGSAARAFVTEATTHVNSLTSLEPSARIQFKLEMQALHEEVC